MKLICVFFILLAINTLAIAGQKNTNGWYEVAGDYVIVDDRLYNYINSFTKDSGRRHFLFAIAMVESGMNPYSTNGSCGEIGMMQVMPATGRFVSRLHGEKYDLSKVEGNIFSALRYLDFIIAQMDKYCRTSMPLDNRIQLAAAAYNGGAGPLAKGCSIKSYNTSARKYSRKFLHWWKKQYTSRKNYAKYFKK